MRLWIVFLVAALVGLLISATLVHSSFPAVTAPDFVLILTVAVSLYFHSAWGVLGAFVLGLLEDFASAQYLGPNAGASVVAFCLVGLIANRVYADKIIAVFIITLICSLAKTLTYLGILFLSLDQIPLPPDFIKIISLQALMSGACAPLVLRALRGHLSFSSPASAKAASTMIRMRALGSK